MNMDIDLNIENYSLNEILQLFQLDYNFGEQELKQAKRIVLKTHPDKCKLPKEYFLFYSKAYKMIYRIFEFRSKVHKSKTNTSYDSNIDKVSQQNYQKMIESMNSKQDFHVWFNALFEKYYIDDNDGHGDWLKSDEDIIESKVRNQSELHNQINNIKHQKREEYALQKHGIQEPLIHLSSGSSNLAKSNEQYYTTSTQQLNGNDLKEAFQMTVIPVTEEDYNNRQHFQNVNQMQQYRKQNINPMNEDDAKKYFIQKSNSDINQANDIAYQLMKQAEENEAQQGLFWSHLRMLQNGPK